MRTVKKQVKKNNDTEFKCLRRQPPTYRRWTKEENFRYCEFLQKWVTQNKMNYDSKNNRRDTFYVQMSTTVLSKSNQQCRTHHLKMLRTHSNIENIIRQFATSPQTSLKIEQQVLQLPQIESSGVQNIENSVNKMETPSIHELEKIIQFESIEIEDPYFEVFCPPLPPNFQI